MLRPVRFVSVEAARAASTTAVLVCCVGLLPGSASLPPEGIRAQPCQHLRSFLKSGPKPVVFDVRNGVITDVDATEIVQRASYAEWVLVRDKGAGIPWTRLKFPPLPNGSPRHFVFWHSIVWLRRNNANVWVMNLARSWIRLGSMSAAIINSAPT